MIGEIIVGHWSQLDSNFSFQKEIIAFHHNKFHNMESICTMMHTVYTGHCISFERL